MDIFEGVLSESEMRYFHAEDYEALRVLLDDSLAKQIEAYVNATGQDSLVLDSIKCFLMPTVETLTFPTKLREEGYTDMVSKLSPQILVSTEHDPAYLEEVHSKLRYLEANYSRIIPMTPVRTKQSFENFMSCIRSVVYRAKADGADLKYPDCVQRIEANRFMFYAPQDKGHSTFTSIITKRHREWTLCLRGLDYKAYCDSLNIPPANRRLF